MGIAISHSGSQDHLTGWVGLVQLQNSQSDVILRNSWLVIG